jgi:hypothetical protein
MNGGLGRRSWEGLVSTTIERMGRWRV